MSDWLHISQGDFVFFLAASLAVLLTPGPAILYIVGVSLDRGPWGGVLSVLGINTGFLFQLALATAGLTFVFTRFPGAVSVITLMGAAYLIYLGISRLRQPAVFEVSHEDRKKALARIYREAAVVSFLNPKSALFLIAFLPQFINPEAGSEWLQFLVLGGIFTAIGFFTDSIYAVATGFAQKLLARKKAFKILQKYVSGGIFILLGVLLAGFELF